MEIKLPKVFANPLDHKIENNKEVFYSQNEGGSEIIAPETIKESSSKFSSLKEKSVNQKIQDIFNSKSYVYKADVKIKLKSGIVEKKIVGKNQRYLITMDNEKIPLEDILDIWP